MLTEVLEEAQRTPILPPSLPSPSPEGLIRFNLLSPSKIQLQGSQEDR